MIFALLSIDTKRIPCRPPLRGGSFVGFHVLLEDCISYTLGPKPHLDLYIPMYPYMGGCQNYRPFLDPYYITAPNIWDHNFDNHPYILHIFRNSWITFTVWLFCTGHLGLWFGVDDSNVVRTKGLD